NGAVKPLPWCALAASFVVQSHYVYIPVVGASVALGIALGFVARRGSDAGPVHGARRSVVAALIVLFACWLFPLLDIAVHWPGNLVNWVRALGEVQGYQISVSTAWSYVVHSIGWVPLAARGPLPIRVLNALQSDITPLAQAVAWIVVALLVVITFATWKRDAR